MRQLCINSVSQHGRLDHPLGESTRPPLHRSCTYKEKKKLGIVSESSRIAVVGLGHDAESTRTRLEIGSPPLLVRAGTNQRRKRTLHPLTAFHGADPHERVRHRGSPHIQPIRLIRRCTTSTLPLRLQILVVATPERARMRRRRTQARLLFPRRGRKRIPIPIHGSKRPVRRRRPIINRKPHRGRRRLRRRTVDTNSRRRRRSVKK